MENQTTPILSDTAEDGCDPTRGPAATLSDLQCAIKAAIDKGVGGSHWVTAEISELKVNFSGHCYLELVERQSQGKAPVASARGVIWSSNFKMISGYFKFQTGSDLSSGMKVLIKCSVGYHPVYGLSLTISDIDPTYTIGESARLRQQTILKLQSEGIFDMNKQIEMVYLPQRLAIISSAQAAGYQDFMKELHSSNFNFETTLFVAAMQGDGAEVAIISAFESIVARDGEFDAVILIRGGGSTGDLACFDSYRLCSYLAQLPIPVITGIGHDKDTSVADMVAHTSVKTPTAVATMLVERARAIAVRLEQLRAQLVADARNILMVRGRHIDQLSVAIGNRSRQRLGNGLSAMESLRHRLASTTQALIQREGSRLDLMRVSVDGASPRRILARGYAIVRRSGVGGVLTATDIRVTDNIEIELHGGTITAEVINKETESYQK